MIAALAILGAAGHISATTDSTTSALLLDQLPGTLPIARTTSGVITLDDLLIYTSNRNLPYSNPLEVVVRAGRSDVREDAAYFIARGVSEMVRVRHYSELAAQMGLKPTPEDVAISQEKQDACVQFTERNSVVSQVTTVPLLKYQEIATEILPTLVSPEQREVVYIFREVKDGTPGRNDAEVRQRMEEVRADVSRGKISIFDAAEKHSEAESAKNKGRIGFVSKLSGFSPRFLDLVMATPQKTLSPVVRLGRGYYLVWVDSVMPERTESMVQSELQEAVLAKYRDEQFDRQVSQAWRRFPASRSTGDALMKMQKAENRLDKICMGVAFSYSQMALAESYFQQVRQKTLIPSEQELRDFYAENNWLGKVDGFWILTKVTAYGGAGQPYPSMDVARDALGRVRDAFLSGTPVDQFETKFPKLKFDIEKTGDWVRSTNNGPADRELNKLPVGAATSIFTEAGQAFFFIKSEQREIPIRPFEQARSRVEEYLRGEKVRLFLLEEAGKLSKAYRVEHIWLEYLDPQTREVAERMIKAGV